MSNLENEASQPSAQMIATQPSLFLQSSSQEWTPHDYQVKAVKFVIEKGAAGLFLDPGLGKTSVTLSAFKILHQHGYVRRMLVVAPLRVCQLVWPDEVEKWTNFRNLRVEVLHGNKKEDALRRDADIYVINPEGLPWLLTVKNFRLLDADMLVIDESTKFKRTTTKRFKLLRKWLHRFKRRVILTGTPAPNGLLDLFGQIYILDLGASIGRYISHYRNTYFTPQGYLGYDWQPKPTAQHDIYEAIKHLVLRMDEADYLTVPELVGDPIKVELPLPIRRLYQEMQREFMAIIEDQTITAVNAGAASIKLRQLVNGGIYNEDGEALHVHDAKVEALKDLIESIQGAPVLVFYQFKHDIKRISDALRGSFPNTDVLPYIGSGVSQTQGQAYVSQFNMGDLPILLAHPASAGHGLNLQARSNHVVFFGPPWDLEHHDQGIKRVWRQGNPNTHVYVHYLIAKDTIDEVIMSTLGQKHATQRTLLDALRSTNF